MSRGTPGQSFFFVVVSCRGLCSVFRSRAGTFSPSAPAADPDEAANDLLHVEVEDGPNYTNNHHVLKDETPAGGGPSRYVGYYDATSLYPSSGK